MQVNTNPTYYIENKTNPKNQKTKASSTQLSPNSLYMPSAEEVRNHYLIKDNSKSNLPLKENSLDTLINDISKGEKKLDTQESLQEAYEVAAKYLSIEHPAKNNVEIKSLKGTKYENAIAIHTDETGKITFNEDFMHKLSNIGKLATIAHETTHQKQFIVVNKYLGDEDFAKLLSESVEVNENYIPNMKELRDNNFQEYLKKTKEVYPIILDKVKNSEVYQKNKATPLNNEDKRKADRFMISIIHYDGDNKEKYITNFLEQDAYATSDYILSTHSKKKLKKSKQ